MQMVKELLIFYDNNKHNYTTRALCFISSANQTVILSRQRRLADAARGHTDALIL